MRSFVSGDSDSYINFNEQDHKFLSDHIKLTPFQENKIFQQGRGIGKTTSMYMTIILNALDKPHKELFVTQELLKTIDVDFEIAGLRYTMKDFNDFSRRFFNGMFEASTAPGGFDDRLCVKVDRNKLAEKYPERMI